MAESSSSSSSPPPRKRARTEEVQVGPSVNEVYVTIHCVAFETGELESKTLGVYESPEAADRRIIEHKISTIIDDSYLYEDLCWKYGIPFKGDSDGDSDSDGEDKFDEEAIERDLDELVKLYYETIKGGSKHRWFVQKTNIIYADSDFVAGFVKSSKKT
jgi:hypothetical protein